MNASFRLLAVALLAGAAACRTAAPIPDGKAPIKPRAQAQRDVRFIAVGDTGLGNDAQRAVARAMYRQCEAEGCDFVVLLGDNIYPSGVKSADDPQWKTKFEEPFAGLDLPFWAALGNHDYGGKGRGDQFEKPESQLAYAKKSPKFRMPARRYQFNAGPIDFFALDTNAARWGRDPSQKDEVAGWIARSTAPWKIVFGHHPYYSNGHHGNAGDYEPGRTEKRASFGPNVDVGVWVKALLDQAVCGKADVYLSGHDHNLQWLEQQCGGGTELIVSGAGSEVTHLTRRNPVRFDKESLGFLYVIATAGELRMKFVSDDGKTLYDRTLSKKAQQ